MTTGPCIVQTQTQGVAVQVCVPRTEALPRAPAFEHQGHAVERQQFYAIACDPQRSVVVEACAGAGKTWMLVSRMLRALLQGCDPQDILAITFTKKAAGEMRQRLHDWLVQFAAAEDSQLRAELVARGFTRAPSPQEIQALRGLYARLLATGKLVSIRTFHSWFAALLANAPLAVLQQLHLPAAYELLEDDAQATRLVWRRFLSRIAQDPAQRADYFAAVAQHGRSSTHKALKNALDKRVEFMLADAHGVVEASVRTVAQEYPAFAQLPHVLDYLWQIPLRTQLEEAAKLLGRCPGKTCQDKALALEKALGQRDPNGVLQALLTEKQTPRKFSAKDVDLASVHQAQDSLLHLLQVQDQHAAWEHQQRMARLTRGLITDYAALKYERGWVDMADLERVALALMSDPVLSGWVQERLDARVRHLLIDEFQDTNPAQWQALKSWLEAYAGAGYAPSVFIVGDPKQSIYRFRRAEPQVFEAAKEFVVQGLGGDILACDHTRRNAPEITALVNQVMCQAQIQDELPNYRVHTTESTTAGAIYLLPRIARDAKAQPKNSASQAAEEGPEETSVDASSATLSLWRDSLTTPRHNVEETIMTLECRQAAQWLAQHMQTAGATLRWSDVMVLARKRDRLRCMQFELRALGIPAQQPEKTQLSDMPEVQDIVALLDVLVSPQHDLSLARVLKSPVFSVSDADLVQLALSSRALSAPQTAATWWQAVHTAPNLPDALRNAGVALQRWAQWVASLPPHDALSAIYDDADVLANYAAATPAAQRETVLANLRAVRMAALQLHAGRYPSAYNLVRALRAGGMVAPVRADTHAVRLLTIHGAKGLEAPVVVLLDTDAPSAKAESMGVLVNWPAQRAHPERFVFFASESQPSPCARDAMALEKIARQREELNALYVALTRTQHTLVLSSHTPQHAAHSSLWQRVQTCVQPVPEGDSTPDTTPPLADKPSATSTTQRSLEPSAEATHYTLRTLAKIAANTAISRDTLSARLAAHAAPQSAWQEDAQALAAQADADALESRLGQAMHRLLEWVPVHPGGCAQFMWAHDQCHAVAQEFALTPVQLEQAQRSARAILAGEGRWAWDSTHLQWWANEVTLTQRGRVLRIDRLVQREAQWWVLDYKSSAAPQQQAALCAQLLGYQSAVAQAYPEQTVRAAFLTAQGALIEITQSPSADAGPEKNH